MTFKVTKQFVRDVETFIAEFHFLADAQEFISGKLAEASQQRLKIVYRSYQDENLLQEFNLDKTGVLLCRPQYAQGDNALPSSGQAWLVAEGNDRQPQKQLAFFQDKSDAYFFTELKLLSDEKSTATYYLIYAGRIIGTLDQKTLLEQKAKAQSAGKESKLAFYPTPLRTSPRLGPGGYYRTIDEKKEEDDKQ